MQEYLSDVWNYLDWAPLLLLILSIILSFVEIVRRISFEDPTAQAQYHDTLKE